MARPRVRDRILTAAHQLLRDNGAAGLTTRAVAEQAGVTEASVYNNFGDKGGMLHALICEVLPEYNLFLERLAQPADMNQVTWLADVFVAARAYFQMVLPLAGSQLAISTRRKPSQQAPRREFYFGKQALIDRLDELQRQGLLADSLDTGSLALLLMGSAMHTALTMLVHGADMPGEDETTLSRRVAATLLGN